MYVQLWMSKYCSIDYKPMRNDWGEFHLLNTMRWRLTSALVKHVNGPPPTPNTLFCGIYPLTIGSISEQLLFAACKV